MPARGAITQLPDAVRTELEQRLLRGGFAGYVALADWLAEQGYGIGKSAVHRYGQAFERRMAALKIATDQAKALAAESGDDEGAMNEALIRLVQTRTFEILLELDHDAASTDLAKIGRMVADLARASVSQKKWAEQARAKIAAKLDAYASRSGLSGKQAEDLRRELLGVVA
jgi:hypothetical protein